MGRSYLHKEKRRHNAREIAMRVGSALGFIPGAVGALHYGDGVKIKGVKVPTRALIAAGGALGSAVGGGLGYGGTLAYQKASTIGEKRKLTPGQIQKLKKIKRENAAKLGRAVGRGVGYHTSNVTTSALVPHGMFWPRYVANSASATAGGHAGEAAVKAAHKMRMKRKKKARDVKMNERTAIVKKKMSKKDQKEYDAQMRCARGAATGGIAGMGAGAAAGHYGSKGINSVADRLIGTIGKKTTPGQAKAIEMLSGVGNKLTGATGKSHLGGKIGAGLGMLGGATIGGVAAYRRAKAKKKAAKRKLAEMQAEVILLGEQIHTYGFGWLNSAMNAASKIGQNSAAGSTMNKIGQSFKRGGGARNVIGKVATTVGKGVRKVKNFVKTGLGISKKPKAGFTTAASMRAANPSYKVPGM